MVSTPIDERDRQHMAENDPYRQMEGAVIRPKDILSSGEQEAANSKTGVVKNTTKTKSSSTTKASSELNAAEASQTKTSRFINSVRGHKQGQSQGKGKGFFRKAGPLGAIAAILFGGGFFFFGAQSLLGPHLSALYTQQTDLQFTSYSMRNSRLMSYMLDGGNQIKISNFRSKIFFKRKHIF